MGNYRANTEQFETPDYAQRISAATTLTRDKRTVLADVSGGAFAVTLPPVSTCFGIIMDITNAATSGSNALTVKDAGDSGLTDFTLANGKGVTLYSNGFVWRELFKTP